jgi:carbon storage regulator
MLIVRRRAGETLLIGQNVEVEILELGSSQVKLGIRAPREVTVLRKEVQLTKQENLAAASSIKDSSIKEETLAGILGTIPSLGNFPSSKDHQAQR